MKLGPRIIGIAGGLTLLLSGPTLAQTLNFDDLPGTCGAGIPSGYMGFDWFGSWGSCTGARISSLGLNPTGVLHGISSADVGIFNGGGGFVRLKRSTPFVFLTAFLNPAWKEGLNITIIGKLEGVEVFTKLLTLDASTLGSLVNFGYVVDELQFSTTGGTVATGSGPYRTGCDAASACTEFIMDDFTYSNVPEPMSFALTGTGLLGLALFHRRRKRRLEG